VFLTLVDPVALSFNVLAYIAAAYQVIISLTVMTEAFLKVNSLYSGMTKHALPQTQRLAITFFSKRHLSCCIYDAHLPTQ
jgi:hypothetical protein